MKQFHCLMRALVFHRMWMIAPKITIQSKSKMVDELIELGGNATWLRANQDRLNSEQVYGYWMTKQEELDSGPN